MATEGGGKIKSKRQTTDSRPYSRRQSLLGRMTNTVKDMLSPSWVIDLVNGVRKSPPKHLDHHDSDPRQQEPDGEIPVRRELNRMSNEENMMVNTINTQSHGATPTIMSANPLTYSHAPTQVPYNSYRPQAPIPQHIMANGDDQSDGSDYSVATSGCSSLIPQPDRKDYQGDIIQMNDAHLRQMQPQMELRTMPSTMNTSVDVNTSSTSAMEGSFLWSSSKPRISKPQQPAKSQMPSFNSSLLSPGRGDSSGFHRSPYYPGKTAFGGAASYRKSRLKPSPMPYEPSPTRKQVQARPLNNSSLGGVTSSTAKRILDTLERMSTPLSDAKKIPLDGNLSDSMLSLTPGAYRRRRTPNTSLSQSTTEGPPTTKRTLSSYASIATNLHTAPTTEPSSTTQHSKDDKQTSSTAASQNQPGSIDRGGGGGGGRSGKMKRERGSHYSSKQPEEEVEVPDLPTSFVLPVSNITLPPIGNFVSSASPLPPKPVAASTEPPAEPHTNTTTSSHSFSFSSPIVKSSSASTDEPVINKKFQFSSPITVDEHTSAHTGSPPQSGFSFKTASVAPKMKPPTVNFKAPVETSSSGGGLKPATELKMGSVMDILGKPSSSELKPESVLPKKTPTPNGSIGGIQVASEMKTGSVMDILGSSSGQKSTPSAGGSSLTGLFKQAAGSWTCDTCLIQNKADISKCVACETPKPRAKPAPSTSIPTQSVAGSSSLSGLFKQAPGAWTCDTCLIQNKGDVSKCVACETPKPQAKPAPTSISTVAGNSGFAHLIKTGEWTCDTCLIKNKSEATKCVACETPNPKAAPSTMTTSSSKPDLSSLIKKDGNWTCDTCLISNKADVVKCAACETPKPGAKPVTSSNLTNSSTSDAPSNIKPFQFGNMGKKTTTWECETCLVNNKAEANKCIACEMPRPGAKPPTGFTSTGGFSFGVGSGFGSSSSTSNTASTVPSTGFKFGNSTASATKPESSTSDFGAASTGGFLFGKKPENKDDKKNDASAASGFNMGSGSSSTNVKSQEEVAKPAFGGFKYEPKDSAGSDEPSKANKQAFGGFQFGAAASKKPSETNTTDAPKPTGGFQFGKTESSEVKNPLLLPSDNFQFGKTTEKSASEKQTTAAASPFQFGVPVNKDANANVSKPLGAGSSGGFSFTTTNKTVKNDTPPPSFQFNAKPAEVANKDSFSVSKPSDPVKPVFGTASTLDKPTAPSAGFQFGSTQAAAPVSSDFAFGVNSSSTKAEDKPTAAVPVFTFGGPANTDTKPTTGASFPFMTNTIAKPVENSAAAPGFSFNKPAGATTSTTSPGKRGRDDMDNGSDAKKPSIMFAPKPSSGTGFKFGDAKPVATTTATSGFSFGQTSTAAFGTNNPSSNNPTGGFPGFNAGGQSTTTSVFGGPTSQTGTVFGNNTTNAAPSFGSAAPAPAFGTPTTTPAAPGGMNLSTPASFNFGSAGSTPTGSGLFQFSANANQVNSAASVGGANANFTFGQGGAPTQPTAPAAAPAPAFNSTPSFNFTGPTGTAQTPVFGFNAAGGGGGPGGGGGAAGNSNPFNATTTEDTKLKQSVFDSDPILHLPPPISTLIKTSTGSDIFDLIRTSVTAEQSNLIFKLTVDQLTTSLWHEVRHHRITASFMGDVYSFMKSNRPLPCKTLIEKIMGKSKSLDHVAAIKWGKDHEDDAIAEYSARLLCGTCLKDLVIQKCGIKIPPGDAHIGASPDGYADCTCHGKRVLEVKSPHKAALLDLTPQEAAAKGHISFLQRNGKLRTTHKYYTQVQAQMALLHVHACDFIVWTPKDIIVETIEFDPHYWSLVKASLDSFYKDYVIPRLTNKPVSEVL